MAKSGTKSPPSGTVFELVCASQGLASKHVTQAELLEWLGLEIGAWTSDAFVGTIRIGSRGTVSVSLGTKYVPKLEHMRSAAENGNLDPLRKHFEQAERLEVLLLQSELGVSILKLEPAGCRFVATALSTGLMKFANDGATEEFFLQARSLLAANPLLATGLSISEARSIRSSARQSLKQSADVMTRLEARLKSFEVELTEKHEKYAADALSDRDRYDKWFAEKERLLEETRDTYHKHVQTAEAAKFWRHKTWISTGIAWAAFIAFGAMVSFAFWLGFTNLDAIKTYVASLASDNSTVSLTPVVVITVPVLAYAWVLRHLSRVFIQNLTIADDAAYRRLMTMTFLGLTNDPKSGVTQAERAIILNALFRPAPPNTTEDGPPTGLMDIITKKQD